MAEVPEVEESVWSDEEEEEEEMFDEDALRGFRFFWNLLNGEEHDEDDDADEQQLEEWADRAARENEDEIAPNVPSTDFVAQKLQDQGVTFEQLVKAICQTDHEEYEDDELAERIGNELFGKIRIIVSNYTPQQAAPSVQQPSTPEPESVEEPQQIAYSSLDFAAQPKLSKVSFIRSVECC